MENQNKAWQARRLEKAYLRQAEAIKRRLARDAQGAKTVCLFCEKAFYNTKKQGEEFSCPFCNHVYRW